MTTHINRCFEPAKAKEKTETKESENDREEFDEKCIEDVFGGASSPFVWQSKLFTVNVIAGGSHSALKLGLGAVPLFMANLLCRNCVLSKQLRSAQSWKYRQC